MTGYPNGKYRRTLRRFLINWGISLVFFILLVLAVVKALHG